MNLKAFFNSFLPPEHTEDQDKIRKQRLFISINFITAFFGLSYGVMSYLISFEVGVYAMIVSFVFFVIQPFLLKAGIKMYKLGVAIGLYIILLNTVLVYFSGGLYVSPVTPWIIIGPPLMLIFTDFITAVVITVLSVIYVLIFSIIKANIPAFPFTYNSDYHLMFLTLGLGGLVIIFFLITNTFERTKNFALKKLIEKQEELRREREKSENLLLNIFPVDIAEELKTTGKTEAKLHEAVTVIFADIKNFTVITELLSPKQLVEELDFCFRKFDQIIGQNKLEKIKTIGDAYLAAAGVPETNSATASDVIIAAIAMQQFAIKRKLYNEERNLSFYEFRIGIHSGPVIAGVVGEKKFVYDIWGDTVNLAARMQQAGESGKINISEDTYHLVREVFNCTYRGKLDVKNKGMMDMYFVEYDQIGDTDTAVDK